MSNQPLYLLQQNRRHDFLEGVEFNDLILHYDHYMRVARGSWLKHKYGELKIPVDLFASVVDADITPDVLDRWYAFGGLNCVYFRCKTLFSGGEEIDYSGIRAVQEEIIRSQQKIISFGGKTHTTARIFKA